MLNLVYHDTQDETVYQVLSHRIQDHYNIFGGLPDTIENDWIENIEKLEEVMDEYIHLRKKPRDVFEMRSRRASIPTRIDGNCVRQYWRGGMSWIDFRCHGELAFRKDSHRAFSKLRRTSTLLLRGHSSSSYSIFNGRANAI